MRTWPAEKPVKKGENVIDYIFLTGDFTVETFDIHSDPPQSDPLPSDHYSIDALLTWYTRFREPSQGIGSLREALSPPFPARLPVRGRGRARFLYRFRTCSPVPFRLLLPPRNRVPVFRFLYQ